jgi:hypothetical protein
MVGSWPYCRHYTRLKRPPGINTSLLNSFVNSDISFTPFVPEGPGLCHKTFTVVINFLL